MQNLKSDRDAEPYLQRSAFGELLIHATVGRTGRLYGGELSGRHPRNCHHRALRKYPESRKHTRLQRLTFRPRLPMGATIP